MHGWKAARARARRLRCAPPCLCHGDHVAIETHPPPAPLIAAEERDDLPSRFKRAFPGLLCGSCSSRRSLRRHTGQTRNRPGSNPAGSPVRTRYGSRFDPRWNRGVGRYFQPGWSQGAKIWTAGRIPTDRIGVHARKDRRSMRSIRGPSRTDRSREVKRRVYPKRDRRGSWWPAWRRLWRWFADRARDPWGLRRRDEGSEGTQTYVFDRAGKTGPERGKRPPGEWRDTCSQ